jgi:alpha-N-arabinofuranosidase
MKYYNPIIRGFNPDPSVCRVGNDYYLVTSSFEYFPGIPLYHSKDLLNWEQIGNCIDRPGMLPYDKLNDIDGIWAPTIRYDAGVFYVTAPYQRKGNFIVHTDDIKGEWSDPVWVELGGIDPSMFFENGTAYYCTNAHSKDGKGGISVAAINPKTGALTGEIHQVWNGTNGGWLEAPHLYHFGDYYYIMAAEGGTGAGHMETIARSSSIWGPYENCPYNPILTNRNNSARDLLCAGHGDLFQDHKGKWWMVHLGTRPVRGWNCTLGRETFLSPVAWQNGWPLVGENGMCKLEFENTIGVEQKPFLPWKAQFSGEKREPKFIFLRNPNLSAYIFRDGKLGLVPGSAGFTDDASPTFIAIRQPDIECTFTSSFDFTPEKENDEAGILLYMTSLFHCRIGRKRIDSSDYLVVERNAEDIKETTFAQKINPGKLWLRINSDKEFYHFSYSMNGIAYNPVCKASTRLLTAESTGRCFTGMTMGLYAQCSGKTGAVAWYDSMYVE